MFQDSETLRQSNFHTQTFLDVMSKMKHMLDVHNAALKDFGDLISSQIKQQRELTEKYAKQQQVALEEQHTLVTDFVTKQVVDLQQHTELAQSVRQQEDSYSQVGVCACRHS